MPNNNPFAENAKTYLENGYSVIPVMYAEKRPAISHWTEFNQHIASSAQIEQWYAQQYNIGLCMGKLSNLIGVDLDNDVDGIHKQICSLLPETPVVKRGAKGCTKFYQYNGEISKTLKYKGQQIGDLLSDNRQCVLPPSIHPNGNPYVWDGIALCDVKSTDLPKITTEIWNKINELLCPAQQNKSLYREPTRDDIQSALGYINPDNDYDDWLHVGMALHAFSGGAKWAFDLFDNWSAHGEKYKYGEPAQKWESFDQNGNITINTLFYLAKQNGYNSPNMPVISDLELQQIRETLKQKQNDLLKTNQKLEQIQKKMLPAPGLIGLVTQYIQEMSYKVQPILALSGAIVTVGTIYARRAQTQSCSRSNIYCFSIGETGCGKDGPRKAIKELFKRLPDDIKKSLSGAPISSAGLLSAIEKADFRMLALIDEVGHYISAVNGKGSQSYSKEIIPLLTQLYSTANSSFTGFEYSQRQKDAKPRADLEQPCVCVLGSSVPSRIYGAITKDDILDGFMTRWIIMETMEIDPKDNPNMKRFDESCGQQLVIIIQQIVCALDKERDKTFASCFQNAVYDVPETTKAKDLLAQYKQFFNNARLHELKRDSENRFLYTRAYENLEKLSLVAAEIDPNTHLPIITETSVNWAYNVVSYSIERMKALLENIEKTENERKLEIMESKIKQACCNGRISLSRFGDVCRCFKRKERNEMLDDLVEFGRIKRTTDDGITYIEPISNEP